MPKQIIDHHHSKMPYVRKDTPLAHDYNSDVCDVYASTSHDHQLARCQDHICDSSPRSANLDPHCGQVLTAANIPDQLPTLPSSRYPIYPQSLAILNQGLWDPRGYLGYLPFFSRKMSVQSTEAESSGCDHVEYLPPSFASSGGPSSSKAAPSQSKDGESDIESQSAFDSSLAIERLAKIVGDTITEYEHAGTNLSEAGGRWASDNSSDKSDNDITQAEETSEEPENEKQTKEKETLKMLVQRLERQYPNHTVKAVSFSEASLSDAHRLGIEIVTPPMRQTVANTKIMAHLLAIEPRNKFTMYNEMEEFFRSPDLLLAISDVSARWDDQSEAFSRQIIDQFISALNKWLRKMALATYGVTEFRIASAATPVEILNDTSLMILTGTVDYAFFSNLLWSPSSLKNFCKGKRKHRGKEYLQLFGAEDFQIFMIEAKNRGYSRSLFTCMPQMGAECIATMKSSGKRSMAWCLSTGTTWIFGIIYGDRQGKYTMCWIEPMEFDLSELDKSANIRVVYNIFWALACWMLQPADSILRTVFRVSV